jgi:hypothetical protein
VPKWLRATSAFAGALSIRKWLRATRSACRDDLGSAALRGREPVMPLIRVELFDYRINPEVSAKETEWG